MLSTALLGALSIVGGQGDMKSNDNSDLVVRKAGTQFELSLKGGEPFHQTTARVENRRVIGVPGTPIRLALWEERVGAGRSPHYAISLDGSEVARTTETSYELLLRYASFDPLKTAPVVPEPLKAGDVSEMYIVQFVTQPIEEFRTRIRDLGGDVHTYIPNHAYLVQMSPRVRESVARLPFVRWVGPFHPAYRLEEFLVERLSTGNLSKLRYNMVASDKGRKKANLINRIRSMGANVNAEEPGSYVLQATLSERQLRRMMRFNEVVWINRWSPPEADMNIQRNFGGANYLETVAGYTGQGVRAEVLDTGIRQSHVDFQDPPVIVRSNSSDTSHGTSTNGIVYGQGRGSALGRGMLPAAQGISASFNALGNRYAHTQQLVSSPLFGVLQSNSWGSSPQGVNYDADSFLMDDIIFDLDILICQSQSNLGSQLARPQAWAKNIVSVGGVWHFDTLTRADDKWAGGPQNASIGPAADGRIKPDLTDFYDAIFCTSNGSNTSYTSGFNGTSGATPIVAGHFGLFFQMWAEGVLGQTVNGTTVFDARPHFSTAKAMVINTAIQYPFMTAGDDLSRMKQGWGTPNVQNLFDIRNKLFIVDESDVLLNLGSKTYRVYVASGEPAFKATMTYADPPGATNAARHRKNDLTLRVTSPTGDVYWGNSGLGRVDDAIVGNWSSPIGVADTINTVENVFVQNPAAGVWEVRISADEIVEDGHVETPAMDADYALVVSGVTACIQPTSSTLERGLVVSGTLADTFTSNDSRLVLRPGVVLSSAEAPVRLVLRGTSPTPTLSEIRFKLEAATNIANIGQRIELYNWTTSAYEQVDFRNATTSDSVVEVVVSTDASRFVNPADREVKARVGYKEAGPVLSYPWRASIDQVRWCIAP